MVETQHTPTPWELTPRRPGDKVIRISAGDSYGGVQIEVNCDDCDTEIADANAEFIVRAVNSHAALVAALTRMLKAEGGFADDFECGCDSITPCHLCEARVALGLPAALPQE